MTSLDLHITRMDLAEQVIDGLCSTPFVCACGNQVTGYANRVHCAMCGWYEETDIQITREGAVATIVVDGTPPLRLWENSDSVQITTRNGEGKFTFHAS